MDVVGIAGGEKKNVNLGWVRMAADGLGWLRVTSDGFPPCPRLGSRRDDLFKTWNGVMECWLHKRGAAMADCVGIPWGVFYP